MVINLNKLDVKFYNLIRGFKILDKEVILDNIKSTYLSISDENKKAIENFLATFNYWGSLDYENNDFTELEKRCNVLKMHADDFLWLYKNLGDYRSKQVLFGILNYWYNNDFNELGKSREENYDQYFDLDLIKPNYNATYVDIGAYTGDTIINYINTFIKYKKIYAYEVTDESIKIMQESLKEYPNIIPFNPKLNILTNNVTNITILTTNNILAIVYICNFFIPLSIIVNIVFIDSKINNTTKKYLLKSIYSV